MTKLPQIRASRLIAALKRAGFRVVTQSASSHVALRRGSVTVIVPMHQGRDVPTGTARDILKRAEISLKQLRDLL